MFHSALHFINNLQQLVCLLVKDLHNIQLAGVGPSGQDFQAHQQALFLLVDQHQGRLLGFRWVAVALMVAPWPAVAATTRLLAKVEISSTEQWLKLRRWQCSFTWAMFTS